MQTFEPRIDCNNKEVHGGHSEKIIRQKLWKNHKSFPTIETPLKLCVIDKFDDLFSEAVETLEKCARVGLSCEGKMLGRHGQLCWVALSTEDDVFMFDIISLGEDVFKFGLRHILQEGSIRKIVHDARFIADCLHHQYGVEIVNMYDTMVGDQVFLNQQVFEGFLPSNFRSLSTVLRDYLGIEDYHIFYPRYRSRTPACGRLGPPATACCWGRPGTVSTSRLSTELSGRERSSPSTRLSASSKVASGIKMTRMLSNLWRALTVFQPS